MKQYWIVRGWGDVTNRSKTIREYSYFLLLENFVRCYITIRELLLYILLHVFFLFLVTVISDVNFLNFKFSEYFSRLVVD